MGLISGANAQSANVSSLELTCEKSIFSGVSACQESLELLVETPLYKRPIQITCQTTWEISYLKNKDKKIMRFDNVIQVPGHQGLVSKKFYVRQNIESTSEATTPVSKTSCFRSDLTVRNTSIE